MKAIGLAVFAIALSGFAQVTQTSHGPNSPNVVGQNNNVSHSPTPPSAPPLPPPQATPVEPKHSEATANLRAAEAEKSEFMTQQRSIIQAAQEQLGQLRAQIEAKDKEEATYEEEIRKENGWGPEVQYVPGQMQPDGAKVPGKWQKTVKK